MHRNLLVLHVLPGLLLACLSVASALAGTTVLNYEAPPGLRAGEVLSTGLLRSGNHRVGDEIEYADYLLQFELETDYGSEAVISKALLKIRVHEAAIIAEASNAMQQLTKARDAGIAGQVDDRDYLSARQADPRNDLDAGIQYSQIRLSGKKKTGPGQPAENKASGFSESVSPAGSDAALDAHKRALAARLQMDVYTSNEVAQALLNKLARSRSAGMAPLDAGFFVERDPETKLARGLVDADVRRSLKDNNREELRELNDQVLTSLMIAAELRQQFLDHPVFSPRHRTYIVAYLEHLGNIEGREAFLMAALSAGNETQALFYEQWARMLAVYDEQVETLTKLSQHGSTVTALTTGGTLMLAQPVDIVYWSENIDLLTGDLDRALAGKALSGRELVITGTATTTARRELEGRGITIRDNFLGN